MPLWHCKEGLSLIKDTVVLGVLDSTSSLAALMLVKMRSICVSAAQITSCSLSGMWRLLPICKTPAFSIPDIYLHSSTSYCLWTLYKTLSGEKSTPDLPSNWERVSLVYDLTSISRCLMAKNRTCGNRSQARHTFFSWVQSEHSGMKSSLCVKTDDFSLKWQT